jgi:hypothetical protein
VRRLFESVAWLLIGVMFLYALLQSFGVVDQMPENEATIVKRVLTPPAP